MASADHDIIVIGGGTAGLVTAAGSAALGARVALVERERLGGDCLWTGCVPSKALMAAARTRHLSGQGGWAEAGTWIRGAQARVAQHDDPDRFRAMGVEVVFSPARLAGPGRVEVRDRVLRGKRIVIATGALPTAPPIPGLQETGYWTYLTAFEQATLPPTIAIIGGGPIGIEFAQAYARLGVKVTLVERLPEVLPTEDPEVGRFIRQRFEVEGIAVHTGFTATRVTREGQAKVICGAGGERIIADELLVTVGRRPNTAGLDLEGAGLQRTSRDPCADHGDLGLREGASDERHPVTRPTHQRLSSLDLVDQVAGVREERLHPKQVWRLDGGDTHDAAEGPPGGEILPQHRVWPHMASGQRATDGKDRLDVR